jgi:methane/ammonia monooxygenase subunit B
MDKRLVTMCTALVLSLTVSATRVFAHGEAGDEPFLKNMTTAFYDVSITPSEVEIGQPVIVTGKVKVLETWPHTLEDPGLAAIVPVVPGPVFAMKDRTINDQPSVGSFFAEKGGIYEFKMTLLGKEPGKWHVHPGIAISGTGTLVGPGDWVTVKPGGKFEFPLTLLDGKTIELSTYGGQFVWWWSFAGFLLGMAWMVYWTFTKRTVTNLAVTMQLPINDDGPDIGLITPRDHMWMNIIAGLTVALLIVGWTYAATSYPVRWPQQTDWITPRHISSGPMMAEVRTTGATATYDDATDTLVMKVQVKNVADSAIDVNRMMVGLATFVKGGEPEQAKAGPREYVGLLQVQPNEPVAPGETKELTLTVESKIFSTVRLIPLNDPQQFVAAVLEFQNAQGGRQLVTVRSSVVPTIFRGKFLP